MFLILSMGAAVTVPSATAAPPGGDNQQVRSTASGKTGAPTIVGLGDSYMSGEGVMWSNKNYLQSTVNGKWSEWQTAQGDPSGNPSDPTKANNRTSNVWGQVFGDENGYPMTGGKESIAFCDRSYAAPMHIDKRGWTEVNLACSGATATSQNKNVPSSIPGGFGCATQHWKPGIDFFSGPVKTARSGGWTCSGKYDYTKPGEGQALMLQNLAKKNDNIKVIALSIGGNDFGFADIASSCVKGYTFGSHCEQDNATKAKVTSGAAAAKSGVTKAISNIAKAMHDAGYAETDWKLVYQMPPLPVGTASQTKYVESGTHRQDFGGCGLWDGTYNWIVSDVYPKLGKAMRDGVIAARSSLGATEVTFEEGTKTFEGHRLCDKAVTDYTSYPTNQAGRTPPWQNDNGIKTEWINPVILSAQLTGNDWEASEALHPNYWGQRALADCMNQAADSSAIDGASETTCTQDPNNSSRGITGTALPGNRPVMQLGRPKALWARAVSTPTITGNVQIGQTLTAQHPGVFTPTKAALDYSYQWLLDGKPISGATNATYKPVAGDAGKTLAARVTAWPAGEPMSDDIKDTATSTTVTVPPPALPPLRNTAVPTITGTAVVGGTLTASTGAFTPTGYTTAFQWIVDNRAVPGATGATYTPKPADVGKEVKVRVTATLGTQHSSGVSAGQTVAPATMAVTGKPTITGKPTAGETLTADRAGVTFQPGEDQVTYQWYSNGKPIPGAHDKAYQVDGADVGTVITVAVLGHKAGYKDAESAQSDATAPVATGIIRQVKPATVMCLDQVTGAMKPLTSVRGRCRGVVQPQLAQTFTQYPNNPKVQWTANGKPIVGANAVQYTPVKADLNKQLAVQVTTTNQGFKPITAKSPKSKVTAVAVQPKAPSPFIKEEPKVGRKLHVTKAHFSPKSKVRYQWMRSGPTPRVPGTRIKGATGRSYTPTAADIGHQLWVRATTKPTKKYLSGSLDSYLTGKVKRGPIHGNG